MWGLRLIYSYTDGYGWCEEVNRIMVAMGCRYGLHEGSIISFHVLPMIRVVVCLVMETEKLYVNLH